jgi:hypothetical protein
MAERPVSELAWQNRAALNFVLHFAQADWEGAQKMRSQAGEFLDGPAPSRQLLASLHKGTKALFAELMEEGYAGYRVRLTVHGLIMAFPDRFRDGRLRTRNMPNTDAMSVRDRFLYRVVQLVTTIGAEKVLRCQAPRVRSTTPCGRLFVKVTRKEFCTPTCAWRAHMRTVRKRESEGRVKRVRKHGKKTRKG